MTEATQEAVSLQPTMNEQFEGSGKEYMATPIRIPDIEVVGPRLLVKPPKIGDIVTKSGIVIPERAQERVDRGLVLIVGDGIMLEDGTRIPSRYEEGMEVLYAKYAGAEIELYGDVYLIINEADVRCILERFKIKEEREV